MCGWVKFITGALLSFSVVENRFYVKQSRFQPVHRVVLVKYIVMLTTLLESKILSLLHEKFV